jgi:hypothetical protein
MDTHISSYPDLEPSPAGISAARLPGEAHEPAGPPADTDVRERLPSSAPKPVRRRRGILLAGVAVTAVVVAGGAFLVSPYNTIFPLPRLQASVSHATTGATHYAEAALRPIVAPSASLAKVTVPPVPPPVREAYAPKPRDQQVAELLSLHSGQSTQGEPGSRPVVSAGRPAKSPVDHPVAGEVAANSVVSAVAEPSADYVPREPGSVHGTGPGAAPNPTPAPAPVVPGAASAPKDATALVIASLPQTPRITPDAPMPPPVNLAPTPAPAPQVVEAVPEAAPPTPPLPMARRDALTDAANLRAGPMMPPEQVQVLNLVTEMAAMVKDLRKQQAQLRTDLGRSSTDTSARLTDFERRLAFAEARNAVTAADTATDDTAAKPSSLASDASPTVPRVTPVSLTRPVAVVPSPLVSSGPKTYRVQAASPGLALLAQVDRGGGDGAQIQVVVGDNVPDYGRVKSIAQKGTAWVVSTEHGAIQ